MKYPESERVKEIRGTTTLRKFAEQLDTSASNITAIEQGKQGLAAALAKKIAIQYDVSLDWLYGLSKHSTKVNWDNTQIPEQDVKPSQTNNENYSFNEATWRKIAEEKDERIKLLEKFLEEQRQIIEHYKDIASKLSDKS